MKQLKKKSQYLKKCSCGENLYTNKVIWKKGKTEIPDQNYSLVYFDCPKCKSTNAIRELKGDEY